MFKIIIIFLTFWLSIGSISAELNIKSEEKSWAELSPSKEFLYQNAKTILISLSDYLEIDINSIHSNDPLFNETLKNKNCLVRSKSLILDSRCLRLINTEFPDAFEQMVYDLVSFYDQDTPSFDVKLSASEYSKLDKNEVFERLKSKIDSSVNEINPISILSSQVYNVLWTVPGYDANCFGTAYTAVTPNVPLKYRDLLWSNYNPAGYDRYKINDELVFGDIIEFEIPGDGHAIVYVGTDQEGEQLVLTKNGFMPSVLQVMKYKDVYRIYEVYSITKVNVWRYNSKKVGGSSTILSNSNVPNIFNPRSGYVKLSVDELMAKDFAFRFKKWMTSN